MASITSWMRLEPRCRNAEMEAGLQARIHDPLWLLARQWQLGEFEGEDNGSPIMARWRAESGRLSRYHAGAIATDTRSESADYDPGVPLETLVEREIARPAAGFEITPRLLTNLKTKAVSNEVLSKLSGLKNRVFENEEQFFSEIRAAIGEAAATSLQPLIGELVVLSQGRLKMVAEAGQQFLRILDRQPISPESRQVYRDAFIRQYPFAALTPEQRGVVDEASLGFFDLMALRVPAANRLAAAFRAGEAGEIRLAPELQIADADLAEVEKAARLWLQWYETFFSEPAATDSSWTTERMEYAFSVGTRLSDREHVLTAREYYEGHLDWYSFDENPEVTLGGATDDVVTEITRTVIPAPVSFPGMAAARFWEFEDAQVDFGSVEAARTDLSRMLLVEFALNYGNDWFVLPIELEIGALYRTRSLVVTDTFGVRTLIKPHSESGPPHSLWRMFQLSAVRESGVVPAANEFFLPPALMSSLESPPIEEVLFLRDEMANMAWAVERVVENPAGIPLNRFEAYLAQKGLQEDRPTAPRTTEPNALLYRLSTEVPDYWVPLLPVRIGSALRLERGAMLKTDGAVESVHATGRILESERELSLFEEEVPREGVRVTRSYQFTRWIDGSSHLWIGRRKAVGRGEGSSGLHYDSVAPDRAT